MKSKFLIFCYTFFFINAVFCQSENGQSGKTTEIRGHAPYIESIGGVLGNSLSEMYDNEDNKLLTTGSEIFIPSSVCSIPHDDNKDELISYFTFRDKDGDYCRTDNTHLITWYFIQNKSSLNWSDVSKWAHLDVIEINNDSFPGSIKPAGTHPDSAHTSILTIPNELPINFSEPRIGFIYRPETQTGTPQIGNSIKVWDLTHFFGQDPITKAGENFTSDEGKKLGPTNQLGSSIIQPAIKAPEIMELYLSGDFIVDKTIKANYILSPPPSPDFEDVSRIWWGLDDTIEQAYFKNPIYSKPTDNFLINNEHLGKVIEATLLPIYKTVHGYQVVGTPLTAKSDDPNNQIMHPPVIANLNIPLEGKIGEQLTATMDFTQNAKPSLKNASTYRWALWGDTLETIVSEGVMNTDGTFPETHFISERWAGKKLVLTITAIDTDGRIGNTLEETIEIEKLISLSADPNPVTIYFNSKSFFITGFAHYSLGSKINVGILDYSTWSSSHADINITKNGLVSIRQGAYEEKIVDITFKYEDLALVIPLTLTNPPPKILALQFLGEPYSGQTLSASYQFNFSGASYDNSTYSWLFEYEAGQPAIVKTGRIEESGKVPESPILGTNMIGKTVHLKMIPETKSGNIGEEESIHTNVLNGEIWNPSISIISNHAAATEENNVIKVTLVNSVTNEGIPDIKVSATTDTPNIKFTLPENATNSDGEFLIYIGRTTNLGGKVPITINVSNNISMQSEVNFAQVKNFSHIIGAGNHRFELSDKFPTTTYNGAKFTLVPQNSSGSSLSWFSSSFGVASVSPQGIVTIDSRPLADITITARNEEMKSSYTFKPKYYFVQGGILPFNTAFSHCRSISGRDIPSSTLLSTGQGKRGVGTLWGEWTLPTGWPTSHVYWGIEEEWSVVQKFRKTVNLSTGEISRRIESSTESTVCVQTLTGF